jgi:hypothetical protein
MGHCREPKKKIEILEEIFSQHGDTRCLVGFEQDSYEMTPGFEFRMLSVRVQTPATWAEINNYEAVLK